MVVVGCGEPELPPLVVGAVRPDRGPAGQSVPVTISGRGFLLDVQVSLLDEQESRLGNIFLAQLNGLPLREVRYRDARHLSAVVPGLLPEGAHSLRLFDARGRSAELADAFVVEPAPWWDGAWGRRRQLIVENAALTEPLDDFPLLVRLEAAWFDYASVAPGGADLRVVAADGLTVLDHELERFDPAGESLLWVRAPRLEIPPASVTLMLYYGNAEAVDDTNPAGVWRNGYQAVYHLETLADSTGRLPDAEDSGATATTGVVGLGRVFDGTDDLVALGEQLPLLGEVGAATLSVWARPTNTTREQYVVAIARGNAGGTIAESRATLGLTAGARVIGGGRSTDNEALRSVTSPGEAVIAGSWYHLAAVIDYGGDRVSLWRDGAALASNPVSFAADATPATPARSGALGAQDNGQGAFFAGQLDEVRVAAVARSTGWLAAEHLSVDPGLVTVGPEETAP